MEPEISIWYILCRPGSVQNMHMKTRLAIILEKAPLVLLVSAAALTVFVYGVLVGAAQIFPYRIIADGIKTGLTLLDSSEPGVISYLTGFSEVPPENAAANRIRFMAGATLSGPLLWYGGRFQFLDLCPGNGCLAVEYTDAVDVAHAWPYRPAALERAAQASTLDEFPYELSPVFSFAQDVRPVGISMYPNRDLLVTFHSGQSFPFHGGVARIDSDGQPVWFRRDFSHHWPQVLDDGTSLVPGLLLGSEDISFEIAKGYPVTVNCGYDRPYLDTVTVIDGQGRLLKRVNLVDVLLRSPFAPLLQYTSDPCDPLHLNYVVRLGPNAGGTWGMAPGDLVVSLRNLSAFAILDRESFGLKRLVRGSFLGQHAVTHWKARPFCCSTTTAATGRAARHGCSKLTSPPDARPRSFPTPTPGISARPVYRWGRQNRHLTEPPTGDSRIHSSGYCRGGPACRWRGAECFHLPARRFASGVFR